MPLTVGSCFGLGTTEVIAGKNKGEFANGRLVGEDGEFISARC
ncbi:MAG: hypothetical protein QOI68_5862 [Pseudonocardiales bacterium]|jgi:hypothetical protein|nr:hypothetical protein [Pseudonocardiales bacterium]